MRGMSMTGGHFKRFGVGIVLSVLLLLMTATGWATPTVTEMQPPDGSMQPVTTTASATFSEAMDPATVTTGSVTVSRFVGVKAIAAGRHHTVAVKGDGTVVAWGRNQYGWGGDNYGEGSVPTGLSGVTAIAAGDTHTVALKDDGTVVAWGNTYPAAAPWGLSRVIAIAVGTYHSVALKDDGTVVAWGGNETNFDKSMVPATLTGVIAIAARGLQTVALKTDGTVVTWASYTRTWAPTGLSGVVAIAAGSNHVVALKGNGTVVGNSGAPAGLSGVVAIAAGDGYSLALKNDGTVAAWGNNTYNQTSGAANLSGIVAIAGGGNHAVALKNDGTIVTWGSNAYGQTSIPTNLSGVIAIAAGGDWNGGFTVALKADNTMAAWGSNYYGETAVPANLSGVIAIDAGRYYTVALKSDGTVVTLGRGPGMADLSGVKAISAGMFHTVALKNDGTVVNRGGVSYNTVPAGLSGVKAISAGSAHTLALKNDGTVVAWGWNASGQTTVPAGLSGVVAIAAGGNHSVALKGDGTVVAWGNNNGGQTNVPAGLSRVVAIAAGYSNTIALKNDGTVVAWGGNSNGVPAGLSEVVAIAGDVHSMALKGDGTIVAWGNNNFGQCTVPTSPYVSPVAGTVDYDQSTETATFTPSTLLQPNATYLATVNTGARNVWGERLATDVNWRFTTDKALATVTLEGLNQTYDGTPKTVSATTDPTGLTVVTTYNGSTTPPIAVGSYNVVATVSDATFTGQSIGTLTITKPTYTVGVSVLGDNGDIWCESPVTEGENSLCTITSAANYHLETFSDNNIDQLAAVSGNTYTISNIMADHAIAGTFAINLRANAGIDQTVPCADPSGAQVVLNGSASIGAATFTWSGPFGTISGVSPAVTIPLGTHTLTLTVADSTGRTASDTVVITVFDNSPPQITIMGVANGMTYNLGLVPLATYAANDAQSGLAGSTGVITGTPDAFGCGTFTYTVTATDNAGNIATSSVTYAVKATPAGTSALIDELVNAGLLPAQTAETLQATLAKALSGYDSNPVLGDNMMNTFQNQINAALNSGKINATTAALLNNAANYIMVNN